jgi:tetratricopeptide (TPR) repeat protein
VELVAKPGWTEEDLKWVTDRVWSAVKPTAMSWVALNALVKKFADYFEDRDVYAEFLEKVVEGRLTYDENEKKVDKALVKRDVEALAEGELTYEEQQIVSVLNELKARPELVERYRDLLASLIPSSAELVGRLEEAYNRLESVKADRDRYRRELELLREELERLKREMEAKKLKTAITSEQLKRLETEYRASIYRELGRVPRDAMSLFEAELDAIRTVPYDEAVKVVEELAKEVVRIEREKAPPRPVVPRRVPAVRRVAEVFGAAEMEMHPDFERFLREALGITPEQYYMLPPYGKTGLLPFFGRWLREKRGEE